MPSPHHHHHHHHHSTSTQCCCCCCCSSSSSPSSPSPIPLTTSDQLLQLLATHLLLQRSPPPPPHHLNPHQYLKPHQYQHQPHHQPQPQTQNQSLLRRVAALEASLPHLSASSHPPPPPPPTPPVSLRDLAARTIQAGFRRFLVRRSQALRHLKRLATVKSHAAALKSSLSDRNHPDPKALSQSALDLLLELDSIQSGDPMIREGRRSISRELVRILEFVDKVLAKEQQLSLGAMKIATYGSKGRTFEDDGVPAKKLARRVSFTENREESHGSDGAHGPFPEEFIHGGNVGPVQRLSRELLGVGGFSRVFAEDGEEDHLGISGDEKSSKEDADAGLRHGMGGQFHLQNGNLGLSAPLPLQMESMTPRRR